MGRGDDLAIRVLRQGHPLRIKTRGASMLPLLRDGDVVTVTPAAPAQLRIGDVVCYETPLHRVLVHRVVARAGDRVFAKGDALSTTDCVEAVQLLGKVTAIERAGRRRRLDTRRARIVNGVMAVLSRRTSLVAGTIHVARLVRHAARG